VCSRRWTCKDREGRGVKFKVRYVLVCAGLCLGECQCDCVCMCMSVSVSMCVCMCVCVCQCEYVLHASGLERLRMCSQCDVTAGKKKEGLQAVDGMSSTSGLVWISISMCLAGLGHSVTVQSCLGRCDYGLMSGVGQNHTYIRIYGVYTVYIRYF
jgi:hypothetical protein